MTVPQTTWIRTPVRSPECWPGHPPGPGKQWSSSSPPEGHRVPCWREARQQPRRGARCCSPSALAEWGGFLLAFWPGVRRNWGLQTKKFHLLCHWSAQGRKLSPPFSQCSRETRLHMNKLNFQHIPQPISPKAMRTHSITQTPCAERWEKGWSPKVKDVHMNPADSSRKEEEWSLSWVAEHGGRGAEGGPALQAHCRGRSSRGLVQLLPLTYTQPTLRDKGQLSLSPFFSLLSLSRPLTFP